MKKLFAFFFLLMSVLFIILAVYDYDMNKPVFLHLVMSALFFLVGWMVYENNKFNSI